jgi:putative copper export protein
MEASLALILEAIFTCLAVLSMTFWIGGVIWEIWILPPSAPALDPDLAAAADAAGRRFRRLAPYALGIALVADAGLAVSQRALLVGGSSGRFGLLWSAREILIIVALVITLLAVGRARVTSSDSSSRSSRESSNAPAAPSDQMGRPIPDFGGEVVRLLVGLFRLPDRLVAGFLRQDRYQQALCVLGLLLLITFVLPERGALLSWASGYSVATGLLFYLCEAVWLGGLLYIGYILLPATADMTPRQRARLLALGLPQFGAIAIIGGAVLVVTGLLNSTLQLIPWTELLTTIYGRTLAVMFELLLVLAGMSAYHAFFLRPRLAQELNAEDPPMIPNSTREQLSTSKQTLVGAAPRLYATPMEWAGDSPPPDQPEPPMLSPRARALEERLRDWLRREALLAGALLLCVVLLGIFAVSLLPNLTSAGVSGQSKGPYIGTEAARNYIVTMKVSPDIFGTNTFTVTLKDAAGRPVAGAYVLIETDSLDMDMGIQTIHLRELGAAAPGSYSGQSELTMAGHWKATVTLQVPGNRQSLTVDFQFSAAY